MTCCRAHDRFWTPWQWKCCGQHCRVWLQLTKKLKGISQKQCNSREQKKQMAASQSTLCSTCQPVSSYSMWIHASDNKTMTAVCLYVIPQYCLISFHVCNVWIHTLHVARFASSRMHLAVNIKPPAAMQKLGSGIPWYLPESSGLRKDVYVFAPGCVWRAFLYTEGSQSM